MQALRVPAFVPYPLGTAPSQRFRLEQWAPLLRSDGFELRFSSFADPTLARRLQAPRATLMKILGMVQATYRLMRALPARGDFDVALVHRGMSLLGPAFFERRLASRGPIVYDFDDAIHLLHTSAANRAFGWLKFPQKTRTICELSRAVIVGNEFLAEFAREHCNDVTVVPSSVDTDVYKPASREPSAAPVVGWMGSSTSQTYLEPFSQLLERLAAKGLVVRIVSDRQPTSFAFPFEWKAWSAGTEVDDLRGFDVGIMPLPDTEWARGKCAMKILQYMGVGVASVGSALGGNLEVIHDGQNGLLASSVDEWVEKVVRLAHDRDLARRLGAAGRETVVARYSASVCSARVAKVLRRAADTA